MNRNTIDVPLSAAKVSAYTLAMSWFCGEQHRDFVKLSRPEFENFSAMPKKNEQIIRSKIYLPKT